MSGWPMFALGVACGLSLAMVLAAIMFETMRRRGEAYIEAGRTLLVLDWPRRPRR